MVFSQVLWPYVLVRILPKTETKTWVQVRCLWELTPGVRNGVGRETRRKETTKEHE